MSAKQNLSPPRRRGPTIVCQLLGLFFIFVFVPQNARADSLEESGRALARKVWSSIHATSVTCDFRNLSSLRTAEFANLSAAFQEELQRRGVKIFPADAAVKLVVSVTQDPVEYIGVVQIQRKENTETVMEAIGAVNGPAAPEPAFSLTLHREFLFSQESPILDVVLDSDAKHAYVLGPQEISSYEWRDNQWAPTGSEHLPIQGSTERGDRGLIFQGIDSEAVYLSGQLCRVSFLDAKGWSCEKYAEQMPARTVSPETMAGKKMGAWISAAQLETEGRTRIVVTGQDGLARLYEDGPEPVAVFPNWGSEIASVYSGCGSGWQLLVTGKGDWTKPDDVQAIDIKDRRAQSVSVSMEFPGPIVALHTPATRTAENPSANARAVAVDRNLQTGRYEAYQLSITCSK
ncbi:MAG: hypothetical protein ACYDCG_15365 [Candidatus Acidiferrales bacterium]